MPILLLVIFQPWENSNLSYGADFEGFPFFIILTIVKAYYIAWDFMHIRDEKSGLKNSIVLPLLILIPYLAFILLIEADYIFDVMDSGFVAWNFWLPITQKYKRCNTAFFYESP